MQMHSMSETQGGSMSDFKKKPPKKNVTIRVDGNVIDKAKRKKLNISEVCRHALELAVDGKFITPGS